MKNAIIILSIAISLAAHSLSAEEMLKKTDIHRVMRELFRRHVNKKEMSGEIIKTSFKTYIDQFDPQRIYLLDSEVDTFLQSVNDEIATILKNYRRDDYRKYKELNDLIQKAIKRAAKIRMEILAKPEVLFASSKKGLEAEYFLFEDQKRDFADNPNELKKRIEQHLLNSIREERIRFGDKSVDENHSGTYEAILNPITHFENQYLFQDAQNRPLSSRERENLFAMHILKALAESLDAHTKFLDRNEASDMRIRLEKGFKGIGVILEKGLQGFLIAKVIKNSPADKSGLIEVNDKVLAIDGSYLEQDSLEEAMKKLRKETSNSVTLILLKKNGEKELKIPVTLRKDFVIIEKGRVSSSFKNYDNGIIAVISLKSFYRGPNGITSEKDVRKAVRELQRRSPLLGLIIDLRENTGGFLSQAVKVAGLFITNGIVVISKYYNGKERFYRDVDGKTIFNGPIIVLTSKATASAAEIVAGALQDWGVAIVAGDTQTYGKGTIQSQTVTENEGISQFKITVGKYYTVSGKTPQIGGIKADIVVPSYYANELIGEKFLNSSSTASKIEPQFQDRLSDIDPGLKPWYIRYYMPTLQKRQHNWRALLPILRQKSATRLANNNHYDQFIKGNFTLDENDNIPPEEDLQLQEAYNILQDMIALEKAARNKSVIPDN